MLSKYQMKFDQTGARDILSKIKYQPEVIKIGYRRFFVSISVETATFDKTGNRKP